MSQPFRQAHPMDTRTVNQFMTDEMAKPRNWEMAALLFVITAVLLSLALSMGTPLS